jgi:hypothetical protein
MAKSKKAFRRAALRRSKTARLFCHIRIAMSIGRNQSNFRLISPSDDHSNAPAEGK